MPDAQGRGSMLHLRRNVLQGVEGIDEFMPEDKPFERRSSERTTILTHKRHLTGKVIIQDEEQGLEETQSEREGLVLWTDRAREDDECVGRAVVWKEGDVWKKRRVNLDRQKEAFDAEM